MSQDKKHLKKFVILKGAEGERALEAGARMVADGKLVVKVQPPAPAVREFNIEDPELHRPAAESTDDSAMAAEDRRMGQALEAMAGQAEDVTRRDGWAPADAFLRPTGGHGQRPLGFYDLVAPDSWLPQSPDNQNFAVPSTHGVAAPEDFRAPKPGPKRAGDGYVLKSATSFADILLGPEPVKKAEQVKDVDWTEVHGPSRWHR